MESVPAGMRVAIKMWKWYLFGIVVPFAILNSVVIPFCVGFWLPFLFVISLLWQGYRNRWALLDGYFTISVISFLLGLFHVIVALVFLGGCYSNDNLDVYTVGAATIPNFLGCWLIVAAVLGWRYQNEYGQWLALQRSRLSDWQKRQAGMG